MKNIVERIDAEVHSFAMRTRYFHEPIIPGRARNFVCQAPFKYTSSQLCSEIKSRRKLPSLGRTFANYRRLFARSHWRS